ncbi:MAG: toprim domain-containing protein [Actinomycetota bacterium]|nr:toprim domain-containing protein [Actinomycetota bacterium]
MIQFNSLTDFLGAIHQALGYSPKTLEPGKFHRFGPHKSGWAKLFDDYVGGVFGCFRQGISSHWTAKMPASPAVRFDLQQLVQQAQQERLVEQRSQWAKNALRNAELWACSQRVQSGDPVDRYLVARELGDWAIPSCIRLHPGLAYWECDDEGEFHHLGSYPTMLAKLVGRDGQLLAIHRTYLGDGCKADVPTPKKLTPAAGLLTGACIPLAAHRGGVLGIAEGIETAAAASLGSGLPVVAAYCANALSGFYWPRGIERVVIFADNDSTGQQAAAVLAQRAIKAGLTTKTLTPSKPDSDWADVYQGGKSHE